MNHAAAFLILCSPEILVLGVAGFFVVQSIREWRKIRSEHNVALVSMRLRHDRERRRLKEELAKILASHSP